MSKEWDKTKKQLNKTAQVPMWAFILLIISLFGVIVFADTHARQEAYWEGYNDAPQEAYEQYQYEIWNTYDYDTRVQSFWSVIMWEVATHTKEIFTVITLFLILLAVRI